VAKFTDVRPARGTAIVDAFREGGGAGKPMYLKVQLSWAQDDDAALNGVREQWAANVYPSAVLSDLRSPSQFAALAEGTGAEQLHEHVRISSDLSRHLVWLAADRQLGFERVYLHNVNRDQDRFIDAFAEHVLPRLR
jgi:coenzyme F420-dependent glucose-6-phosphate dehydrogenase